LGGLGHIPGVILGAVLLAVMPEALRYVAGPLNKLSDGHLDPAILRQLLIALAMIVIMLMRPRGLWPAPEHGKALEADNEGDGGPSATDPAARSSIVQPPTAQQNPPGVDSPADAIPGTTDVRQDTVNP
jgi:branched-chain amino acid transport system permease protein